MKTPIFEQMTADFKDAEASFILRGKLETYNLILEQLRAIPKPSKQIVEFIGKLEKHLTEITVAK